MSNVSDNQLIALGHQANIKRLTQLGKDADTNMRKFLNRSDSVEDQRQVMYYAGMRDGLKRAINVLEGRG